MGGGMPNGEKSFSADLNQVRGCCEDKKRKRDVKWNVDLKLFV